MRAVTRLVRDGLVAGDRLAELDALLRIGPRLIERGLGEAECACRDFELFDIERAASEHAPGLVELPGSADDRVERNAHVVEMNVAGGGVAQVHMLDRRR